MKVGDYLRVLRRRKLVVILVTLAVTVSAIGFSLIQSPVYESHARVLLETSQSLFQTNVGDYIDPARIQTEIEVINGEGVQSLVHSRIGSSPGATASVVGNTAVIDVASQSSNPRVAQKVANTYADAYVDYRRDQAVGGLLAAAKQLQQQISDLDQQIVDAAARNAAANPPRPNVAPTPSQEEESLRSQRAAFKDKLDQLSVDTALRNGGASVVAKANLPVAPIRPTPKRNAILGLLVGLILGVALAFLVDQVDDSIRNKEDLERLAGGLPVIGLIPKVPGWKNRAEPLLVSHSEPSSPAAEAYRTLRTSIQFFGVDRKMRTILVTSPTAGDGKSTTISNLAVVLARAGQRVAIVSCDLRRPRVHEFFGVSNAIGFTSVLVGSVPLSTALQPVACDERIRIVPSGPLPPNPSELLSSQRASEIITALEGQCDAVLIDCPPVLPVTDAAVLSARVDGVLVVATAGSTTGKQISRAVELLRQVDAPIVGVVLNGAPADEAYGYKYEYYGQDLGKQTPAVRKSANGTSRESRKRRSPQRSKG
jgi:capsular exopolysaccharide synthesis family protein